MYKLFFVLNILTLSCYANSELYQNSDEIKEVLSKNIYEPNYFTMLLGLFVVIGLVYLTGFLYQKMIKIDLKDKNDDINRIEIVSSAALGQGKNLYIIKTRGKYSLIGATANNISYLRNFDETQGGENE